MQEYEVSNLCKQIVMNENGQYIYERPDEILVSHSQIDLSKLQHLI